MSNCFNLEFIEKCIKLTSIFNIDYYGVISISGCCKIDKHRIMVNSKNNKHLRKLWKHVFYELLLLKALENTDYINLGKTKRQKERLLKKHMDQYILD